MRLSYVVLLAALVGPTWSQSGGFELPVQLIGFPVIIIAVRMANFLKKLSYALNPNTYRSRGKRGASSLEEPKYDPIEVEKRLVAEMGQGVCIYERVCSAYASHSPTTSVQLDWDDLFRKYANAPPGMGENYLLSVFLGDIIGSPTLCRQLAKRGRSCEQSSRPFPILPSATSYYSTLPTSVPRAVAYHPVSVLSNR